MKKLILLLAIAFVSCETPTDPQPEKPALLGSEWRIWATPEQGRSINFFSPDSLRMVMVDGPDTILVNILPYTFEDPNLTVQGPPEWLPFTGVVRGDTLIFQDEIYTRTK